MSESWSGRERIDIEGARSSVGRRKRGERALVAIFGLCDRFYRGIMLIDRNCGMN